MLATLTVPMLEPTRWIGALRPDPRVSDAPRAERPPACATDDRGPARDVAGAPVPPLADVRRGA